MKVICGNAWHRLDYVADELNAWILSPGLNFLTKVMGHVGRTRNAPRSFALQAYILSQTLGETYHV